MKDISERVSYLQGLSEGLNIKDNSPQGKVIGGILEVLEEMAEIITNFQYELGNFEEYMESIDDDLMELEENIFYDEDFGYDDEDEEDIIELKCGNCGEELYFNADILDDDDTIEIVCPRCNEVVFVNDGSFDYYSEDDRDEELEVENPCPS